MLTLAFVALASTAVSGAAASVPERLASEAYVDAINYPSEEAGWDRFFDLERRLVNGFDNICGDTFCEGEYSNIQHLRYRCSVRTADGVIGECIWTLAGSTDYVNPATGAVEVDGRIWQCRSPIAPGITMEAFYQATAGRQAIDQKLPGTGKSIYDGLTECL